MIGFDGRQQWRQHQLFKLCAKPAQREKSFDYRWLSLQPKNGGVESRLQNLRFAQSVCGAQKMCE